MCHAAGGWGDLPNCLLRDTYCTEAVAEAVAGAASVEGAAAVQAATAGNEGIAVQMLAAQE
jgi:hypothetical protein